MDFAIQDLIKDRHIGAYQDLAPGGDKILSRSRVHTPPGKGKQRIVHALYSLNDTMAKRQTTYEDHHMLKSVVRPQDWINVELGCGKCVLSRPDPPQASQVLLQPLGAAALCQEQVYRTAVRRLLCLLKTGPRTIGVLGSNASAPVPPFIIKSSNFPMPHCLLGGRARPEFGRSSCP